MERHGYRITGRVQGVGYRAFTQGAAEELGLSGWVRNRPDGSVEARAAGDAARLARFEERLRVGPSASRVDRVERVPAETEDWTDFRIRG